MIGAGSWIDLAHLPRETFDALYATNPDAITAGVFNPTASIVPVDGGYRVDGRWSFASGCEHADVIFGNGVEGIVNGMPQLRGAVFAPDDVTIEDTWSVSGLCGTGSHHIHVDGAIVPAERTYDPMGGEPCIDSLIVHLPPPAVFSLVMASVALGIAQGALDDITLLASDKVPMLSPVALGGNPLFQLDLATADTDLRAARSLLYDEAAQTLGDRDRGRHADDGAPSARTGLRRVGRRPGNLGRHHRVPRRRRKLAVLRLPAPAAPPRHPRARPALHRSPRHPRHRGRDPRRPGRPDHGVLASREAQAAGRASPRPLHRRGRRGPRHTHRQRTPRARRVALTARRGASAPRAATTIATDDVPDLVLEVRSCGHEPAFERGGGRFGTCSPVWCRSSTLVPTQTPRRGRDRIGRPTRRGGRSTRGACSGLGVDEEPAALDRQLDVLEARPRVAPDADPPDQQPVLGRGQRLGGLRRRPAEAAPEGLVVELSRCGVAIADGPEHGDELVAGRGVGGLRASS